MPSEGEVLRCLRIGTMATSLLLLLQSLSSPAFAEYPPKPGAGNETAPLPSCVLEVPEKIESSANKERLQSISDYSPASTKNLEPKKSNFAVVIPKIDQYTKKIAKFLTTDCTVNTNIVLQYNSLKNTSKTKKSSYPIFYFNKDKSTKLHGYLFAPFSSVDFYLEDNDRTKRIYLGDAIVNSNGHFQVQFSKPDKFPVNGYLQIQSKNIKNKSFSVFISTKIISSRTLKIQLKDKNSKFFSVRSPQI